MSGMFFFETHCSFATRRIVGGGCSLLPEILDQVTPSLKYGDNEYIQFGAEQ